MPKTRLRLHHLHLGMYDALEVYNIDTGELIPFEWISGHMVEVDERFDRVAAVRVVPGKNDHRKPPPAASSNPDSRRS